jgi:hypothetical protein
MFIAAEASSVSMPGKANGHSISISPQNINDLLMVPEEALWCGSIYVQRVV